MKPFLVPICVLFCLAVALTGTVSKTSGFNEKLRKSSNPAGNRYIVVLNEPTGNAKRTEVADEASSLSTEYGGKADLIFSSAVRGFSTEMNAKEAEQLSLDPRVSYVEEDSFVSVSNSVSTNSWSLDRIDQHLLPLDSTYNYTNDGTGVHAYVIDSGIRVTHSEFKGRAVIDFDAVGDGQNGNDCNGHGTHVAGLIGGSTYGVAKNVTVHAVRVLPCTGSGLISNLIAGIDWVTAHRIAPAVANISITASGTSSVLDSAVTNSVASGVTFIVAAGNSNLNACNYSPARVPTAITVGATTNLDQKATFSNFGSCTDLFAPGQAILSAANTGDSDSMLMNGTSMASPQVAGVAAMYLQGNRTASPSTVAAAIGTSATASVITLLDTASPNKLLFSSIGVSPAPQTCVGLMYSGLLSPSQIAYHDSVYGSLYNSGKYSGNFISSGNSNFTATLEKKNNKSWTTVYSTSSNSTTSPYSGRNGTYRWKIQATNGSGTYSFCSQMP